MVTLQKVCLVFTIIGAIVWGILGIFNFNLVTFIFGDGSILSRIVYILVGIAFCFPIISLLKRKINISKNLLFVLAFILFVLSVSFTIKGSYNPFIYFNF